MKKNIKLFIEYLVANKLIFDIFRFINRKNLIILYYHRLAKKEDLINIKSKNLYVEIDSFEDQMRFLTQFYNPIGEKEVISAIDGEAKIPENSVWITFDDGFKDNYLYAFPILKKYRIPATFFITTGFINKQAIPCEDYLEKAVRMSSLKEIKIHIEKEECKFSLDTEEHKEDAIKSLLASMKDKNTVKDRYLEELINSFNVQIEDITDLFMSWEEIKEMSNNGFSIGAHTANHKILSTLSKEEIKKEILESKCEIEKKVGVDVFSFAYPRGKKNDFNAENCFPILQSCGFKLGVTTIGGSNAIVFNKNRFTLKRMGISYGDSLDLFKIKVSTASFWQI